MSTKHLLITTSLLFAISILVYWYDNHQGVDLQQGANFVTDLDINKVSKIEIRKGQQLTSLSRDRDRFVLSSHKSYPADVEKFNSFIYKINGIKIFEKVDGKKDDKVFGFQDKELATEVIFYNQKESILKIMIGKNKDGKSYISKDSSDEVYLASEFVNVNPSLDSYVEKRLLPLSLADQKSISIVGDKSYVLSKEADKFVMNPKISSIKEDDLNNIWNLFVNLSYLEFYSIYDPMLSLLKFDRSCEILFANNLIYSIDFAFDQQNYYLKVSAKPNEKPDQIVTPNENIESVIKAQVLAQNFNANHKTWVYKIDKQIVDKIFMK